MVLTRIEISTEYLLESAMSFAGVAFIILVFIIFYLLIFLKRVKTYRHLETVYSDFLSEIILCESPEEQAEVFRKPYVQNILNYWLKQDDARRQLIDTMVKAKKSVYGAAGENIKNLYGQLGLAADSAARMRTGMWHIKAAAIQELAEMEQSEFIQKIYKHTNNKNPFVRKEAQIAIVKLTGVEGLRFLNVLSHGISQWQQICLLEQLPDYAEIPEERMIGWLESSNYAVTGFAVSLAGKYQYYYLHDRIVDLVDHPSAGVRREAARALLQLNQGPDTSQKLIRKFDNCSPDTKVLIVDIIKQAGVSGNENFILSLASMKDIELQLRAKEMIRLMRPEQ